MNIQVSNQQTFTARNKEIRYADKIMRNMINHYPCVSTSKADYYISTKKDRGLLLNTKKKDRKLTQLRRSRRNTPLKDLAGKVIEETRDNKVANCGELALMAMGSFLANGYNDVKLVFLKLKQKYGNERTSYTNIDHCFILVNSGKNSKLSSPETINKHAFIVDPWAGFVDYLESGLTKYEKFFMKGSKRMPNEKQRFILGHIDISIPAAKTGEQVAEKFPELIVKK